MTTANVKISQLPPLTTMGNATIFPVVDGGNNRVVSGTTLRNFLANTGGGGSGNALINGESVVSLGTDGTLTFSSGMTVGSAVTFPDGSIQTTAYTGGLVWVQDFESTAGAPADRHGYFG